MLKVFAIASLLFLIQASMAAGRPDAIRCGADYSCCDGAIYFAHGVSSSRQSHYCQIYANENRCVIFDSLGNYISGRGHYDSRRGCQYKSLAILEKQGRTFNFADTDVVKKTAKLQQEIQKLKVVDSDLLKKTVRLQQEIQDLKKNIQNLYNSKAAWKNQCKSQVLSSIKNNGLEIGTRWSIRQESGSWLVFRDLEGSKIKDSRIAFPANRYKDP